MLRIGRNKAYGLAREGRLPGAVRIGCTYRVRRVALLGPAAAASASEGAPVCVATGTTSCSDSLAGRQ